MSEIQIFNNPQFGEIRIVTNEANEPMFCLADVCKALDLGNPSQVKSRLKPNGIQLIDNHGVITNEGVSINKLGNTATNYINEANLYKCIFQSRKADAEKFQDWVCEEVLPSIRKTGSYVMPSVTTGFPNPQLQEEEVKVFLIEATCRNLRLSDASKLGMYQSLVAPYGLAIPQYVPSKGVLKSATELLKENGYSMSALKFNQLLEERGYIETVSRPSVGGKTRKFKNITAKGKSFGENEVNPKNQKETQPHWYADKFRELYEIVTA